MWNPGIGMVLVTRQISLIPYLSAEGTYGSSQLIANSAAEPKQNQGFLFRPGIGVNILYQRTSKLSFHAGYHAGYGFSISPSSYGREGWVTQCNLGVGIYIKKSAKRGSKNGGNPIQPHRDSF